MFKMNKMYGNNNNSIVIVIGIIVVVSSYFIVVVNGRPQENTSTLFSITKTLRNNTNNNLTNTSSTTPRITTTITTTTTLVQDNNNSSTTRTTTTTTTGGIIPSVLPSPIFQQLPSIKEENESRVLESRAISSGTSENGNKTQNWEFDGPIRRCSNHNGNADVNKCLKQILEDLRPRLAAGIPEINLPAMDPLYLKTVSFHHGSGPIKILATFKDVNATGLSTYDKSDFMFDVKKRTLDFDLTIPNMKIIGNYELSGNLFFFPIGGNGGFWLNLGGIKAKGQGKLGVSAKNNLKSIQIKKIDIELDIETIKVHLTNLFNGDQLLGPVINTFLNENAKEIFEEVKPQIGIQVAEMVQVLANKALASLSSDHFADVRVDTDI